MGTLTFWVKKHIAAKNYLVVREEPKPDVMYRSLKLQLNDEHFDENFAQYIPLINHKIVDTTIGEKLWAMALFQHISEGADPKLQELIKEYNEQHPQEVSCCSCTIN